MFLKARPFKMKVISAAVLSGLFCTVVLASSKVRDEHKTAFFGEDLYINVPAGELGEVVFKPRTNRSLGVVLLQAGRVVIQQPGPLSGPKIRLTSPVHVILENLQEKDEGVYVIRNTNTSTVVKRLIVVVRDCAMEQIIKYGDNFNIHLNHVEGPIALEFRPSLVPTNQTEMQHATEPPPILLYNSTVLVEEYAERLSVSEKMVTLHSVRMTDEGSFTVMDRTGKVRGRNCLNVREHQNFMHLTYGSNLKMNLYQDHSNLNIVYRLKSDNQDRVIVYQGVVVYPLDPLLEGRLKVDGSALTMKKVNMADSGVFKMTDLAGFSVAHVYLEVEPYKLPYMTMAVLSLLGLVALMLLACLLSCLHNEHKRNEKNKNLRLIAEQAGKGSGEVFRQVVHEAYTRFNEDSLMQSVCAQPPESKEVTIKGLEVSKPGRYQALASDNFLEMSDSGVEFNSSGLPLDSDTDGAMTYASHKPLLNAVSPTAVSEAPPNSFEATSAPDGDLSATRTPDSVLSASPASNPRSFVDGAASPGAASRGTTGSGSAKKEGGSESGEGSQNEAAQST